MIECSDLISVLKTNFCDKDIMINVDTKFSDLRLDSLSTLELFFRLEEEYGIQIDESLITTEIVGETTIMDIVNFINKHNKNA